MLVLVVSTILLALFDVYYFIRVIFLIIVANLRCRIKGNKDPFKESVFHGVCLTTDLDFNLHMNNSRYLREMDLGRYKLWLESGVYKATLQLGGAVTLGGSTIRYRKSLQCFDRYKIRTKILCWDQKAFYVEQKMERSADKFVSAIAILKQSFSKVTPAQVLQHVTGRELASPAFPEEVTKWIEMNQISSDKLRKNT